MAADRAGSARATPIVAETLQQRGFATLLFDLLTEREALDRRNVFDIRCSASVSPRPSAGRTNQDATEGPADRPVRRQHRRCRGACRGGGMPQAVRAVVSRGGRPDLAGQALFRAKAPRLLIVGGHDYEVIDLNREAQAMMRCETETGDRAGCDASVRGGRHAGTGRRPGRRVVHRCNSAPQG
jgi:putative phosphoribosyl transferase